MALPIKRKEHLEGGRVEGENIKAKLQTGEFGLDMAEYMGEYKIIRRMDGGGNANVLLRRMQEVKRSRSKFFEKKVVTEKRR